MVASSTEQQFHGLEALTAPDAVARLAAIRDALATSNDPDALTALAKAIPSRVARLAPEVSLLLADVAASLLPYRPTIPRDLDALADTRLRVTWLRVALQSPVDGEAVLEALDEPTLLIVLTGWPWSSSSPTIDALADPRALFRRLGRAADPRLRSMVPERIEGAVKHLAITGEEAFDCLEPLAAADPDSTIRERAIRVVAKFWIVSLSPGRTRLREEHIRRALRELEPRIALAAVEATAELAARRWLVDLLREPSSNVPAGTRAAALDALGPLAEASDLDLAIGLAEEESLQFGPVARRFLLEAHRHGVFLREAHIERVLGLFDAHQAWTGEELVRVTYIARKELVKKLAELPADDERWTRRAAILAASLETGAHRVLEELLDRLEPGDPRTWPIASAALRAAASSPKFAREDLLLRFLDVLPEQALPALRAKGGASTAKRLRAIALDPFTARSQRSMVMDVLWALETDRRQLLTDLADALPPRESGLLDGKYISTRDSTAAELLAETRNDENQSKIEPIDRLKIFCESGDIRFLAEVTRLFREVFRAYVRKALEGDFTIKRLLMPELEQLVFRYGRHLVKDGRPVRRFVEERSPETGRDLVLLLVTDWLNDPVETPSDPIIVALLETASRHAPDGAYLRLIEPFWRRGDANVRRAAIEALVAAEAGARGLELSLGRLVADANLDPRILTQALAAVRTLRATWAEPLVRDVLDRREMAVKKEAAEALAEIGTGKSVPSLVGWVGRHDNASFRLALLRALEKSAGPAMVVALVDALERTFGEEGGGEARTKELLLEALANRISIATVMRLARSSDAAHRAIVDACIEGKITVSGATADELAAHLHRAKLRAIEPKEDPAKRLRIEGFSPEAGRDLVSLRREKKAKLDPEILAIVRSALADWIAWALTGDVDEHAVALVLDAADRSHVELFPFLLDLIERWSSRLDDAAVVVSFFERSLAHGPVVAPLLPLRMRAIAIVRKLGSSPDVGGPRRWRLLGRLGALRTTTDLEACLGACDGAPNVAPSSLALLLEAFSIPTPPSSPIDEEDRDLELEKLYEDAQSLYRQSAPARRAWLERVATTRPIDLPPVPRPPKRPAKPPFKPTSEADFHELLATLGDESRPVQERERAAERILDWPDAAARGWRAVFERYVAGQIDLPVARIVLLAGAIETWPEMTSPDAATVQSRQTLIASYLTERQLRLFVPEWLARWERGDLLEDRLRAIGQERLLPFVIDRAKGGSFMPVRLLHRSASAAFEALLALTMEHAPEEAKHLLSVEQPAPAVDDSSDPIDPIDGKTLDELVDLLDEKGVEKGLAVRAVHALARRFGDRSIEPLARLAVDRRAQIRSAALRALRTVASKERTLEVTSLALAMETRRDVALSLMASLGHGRHEPALPGLLERLTDRDHRIRQGAHDALLAWGREVVPALRHAARRARPDRREHYAALIEKLS